MNGDCRKHKEMYTTKFKTNVAVVDMCRPAYHFVYPLVWLSYLLIVMVYHSLAFD